MEDEEEVTVPPAPPAYEAIDPEELARRQALTKAWAEKRISAFQQALRRADVGRTNCGL